MPAVMDIPLLVDEKGNPVGENNFISEKIIKPFTQRLKERQKISEAYHKVIEEIKEQIVLITDAESANDFCSRINVFKHGRISVLHS